MAGSNPTGRQSASYLKTGKAKVWAELIDENGVALTPLADIGNCESLDLGVETETNSIPTGEDDLPSAVKTMTRITAATLNMVCRNHNPTVTIWNMQGEASDYIQPAVPAGEYESTLTYKIGDAFKLPHEAITAITSITDTAAAVTLLPEHFKVDADAGLVYVVGLPDGETELVGVNAAYTAAAITVPQYGGFSIGNGVLARIYVRETADGPRGTYTFNRARVNKDGTSGIIADGQDPVTASFAITLEQDPSAPENFGLFRYRKHNGSL